jgi:tetratricopeptide (TPR) repeat protein
VHDRLGDKTKALEYYELALLLLRVKGDKGTVASTLNNIGMVHADFGNKFKALDYLKQALTLRKSVQDKGGEAVTSYNLSMIYYEQGQLEQAINHLARCVELDGQLQLPDQATDQALLTKWQQELVTKLIVARRKQHSFWAKLTKQLRRK